MSALKTILVDYLGTEERESPFVALGGERPQGTPPVAFAPMAPGAAPPRRKKEFPTERLARSLQRNDWIVKVEVAVMVLVLAIMVWLAAHLMDSPDILPVLIGEGGLSGFIMGIVWHLHRVWRDKCAMSILLAASVMLPPEQMAKLVQALLNDVIK
jgi:hypothetical protein